MIVDGEEKGKELIELSKLEQVGKQFSFLMAYYRCAIMEVETKIRVLNETLSQQYDRNPIETIKSRLKNPRSISEKLRRKGLPQTVASIEENLNDVAGVRVICSFPEDVYLIAEELKECAEESARLDARMQRIRARIEYNE